MLTLACRTGFTLTEIGEMETAELAAWIEDLRAITPEEKE